MTHEIFRWDAGIGEGEWIAVVRMRSWAKAETPDNRNTLVTGTKILIDFGLAVRAITADCLAARAEVHAAEWQDFIDYMQPRLVEANGGRNAIAMRKGLEMLALAATRRGELNAAQTNWAAVRGWLEERRRAEPRSWRWRSARRVYVHLQRLGVINGPAWPREARQGLVPKSCVARAADTRDISCWTTRSGQPLAGLREELSKYLQWASADPLELSILGLPSHAYIDPTPPQIRYAEKMHRRGRGESLFRLEPATLLGRLHHLNRYLGYLEDHDSTIDLSSASLDHVLHVRRLMAFGDYMTKMRETDDVGSQLPSFVLSLANTSAVIGSPFLERYRRALGDEEGAARARLNADRVRKYYAARKYSVRQRKDLNQIIEAWKGSDGVDGWLKLLRLRDLELREAERALRLPLGEQVSRLRQGTLQPNMRWALSIRNAFLINFLRLIPLRRWTLGRLTTQMWVQEGVTPEQMSRPLEMHEGAIMIHVPGTITKYKKDFRCAYIQKSVVGSLTHEYGACREMLELYWAPGGAREFLLRTAEGERIDSPYIFVAPARKVGGRDRATARRTKCRWPEDKMSEYFSVLVFRHGKELNLDLHRLKKIGGTRLHIVRALFGSYFGPRDLVMTADILHHGDVKITKAKYCDDKAATAKREAPPEFIDALASAAQRSIDNDDLRDRIRRLEMENAELS